MTPRGVVVLGPYRSGTSLVSLLCERLGVDFGPRVHLAIGNRRNPGGYYERFDVNRRNDLFLASAGRSLENPGDPGTLAVEGDLRHLQGLDLAWLGRRAPWGLKDPRFCGTLSAWIRAGVLPADGLVLVHVTRSLDAAARSAQAHDVVQGYAGGDEARARRMLARYARAAAWHVTHLGLPSVEIAFEALRSEPLATTERLARFLGIDDARRVRRAARAIGARGRLIVRTLAYKYAVRVPQILIRRATGRGWPPGS